MLISEINKEKLDNFLKKQKNTSFLQSWEWGEFQILAGNKVIRLGVEENGDLVGVVTLIKKNIGFGQGYFYAPRGPVVNYENYKLIDLLFKEIRNIAKKEKCFFLRFEPEKQFPISQFPNFPIFKSLDIQPSKTLILNIDKSEDEILKQMHQKTRYNIRLAERNGVEIKLISSTDEKAFVEFWKIMQETNERDGFRLHNQTHYRKMISVDFIKLIGAFYEGKLIAANILSVFGDTATYVHGASSNELRNLMATYALQWQSIKYAKEQGCKSYDFYGINENKWPGVTRFKKGFGGEEFEYPGTFDCVFNPMAYRVYNFLRKIRRNFYI